MTKITKLEIEEKVQELNNILKQVANQADGTSETEARELTDYLSSAIDRNRDQFKVALAALGLKHNFYIYIGEYGYGENLLLEDDEWSGYKRGDWLPSSESC